jgi:hypothetical protein
MPKKKRPAKREIVGFLGVGLDNADGEVRLTRSEYFVLVGGSEQTHERMQNTAVKFTEAVRRTGKPLTETPIKEVIDLFHKAQE